MTTILNMRSSDMSGNSQLHSLSKAEFGQFRDWLYQQAGIHLADVKCSMVSGRLQKRLHALQLPGFAAYLDYLKVPANQQERQTALNLLTTNETYFFREEKHFQFLQKLLAAQPQQQNWQVWSAAASSGQEAYSIAMTFAQQLGLNSRWQVSATDINTTVLEKAQRAIYSMDEATKIPEAMLKAYCDKGIGKDEGWFRIGQNIRQHVSFSVTNLFKPDKQLPVFDVIFLRNVLIYFESEDKKLIVNNVLKQLKPGGCLLVGHSESIHGYHPALVQLQPSCYRYSPESTGYVTI